MRIAINLRQYFKGRIGGAENYVRHVVGGIVRRPDIVSKTTIFVLDSEAAHVREFAAGAHILALSPADAQQRIEREVESGNYDLLLCPLLVLEPLRSPIASAVIMPDLQHEFYPEFFASDILAWRKKNYQPSAQVADIVFTVSNFSKRTLIDRFGVDAGKIVVLDHDVDEEFRHPASVDSVAAFGQLRLPGDYLYYPANFWPHKNHENLLLALSTLVKGAHPELSLVLTGAADGAPEIKKQIARLGLQHQVRLLDYQSRGVVAELYRHARALTFISKFEGFGIPILEAFHTDCPVLCSSSCSCPEVAGDAAVLVDENDPVAIAAGIAQLLESPGLASALVTKGRVQAERYSWKNAVDVTIKSLAAVPALHATHAARRAAARVESWPVVSITTPTYNMARFLEETIQSVLSQDYPHIEYIVMDAASTDGTLDILRKYEKRLRYISQPDRGQAEAINRGFAATSGSVFAYLNADDTYLAGAVSTAVRHLRNHPQVGMLYGEAYYVDESGKTIGTYPTHAPDMAYLNRNCYICQPASFIWREAFDRAGWMNENQHFTLDYDLWIRIAKLYPMLKIDEFLATSRLYPENKTIGKRKQMYQEILQAASTHFGYVPFDWVFGYSCYLADHKDQFFEKTKPSRFKYVLALALGFYYNPRQWRRFWVEWARSVGIPLPSSERWADGWISKEYQHEYDVALGCKTLHIEGKHCAPFRQPLKLRVRLNGNVIGGRTLNQHGPFTLDVPCPPEACGKRNTLEIVASQTFRPVTTGDYRKLSCIIDTITFEKGE